MLSAGVHSFSAASAGAIATMATHPFDVIKVRQFVQCTQIHAQFLVKTKIQVRNEARYGGFLQTTRTIWQVTAPSSCLHDTPTHATFSNAVSQAFSMVLLYGLLEK